MPSKVEGGTRTDLWKLPPEEFTIVGLPGDTPPAENVFENPTYNHKRLQRLSENHPSIVALVNGLDIEPEIISPITVRQVTLRDPKTGAKFNRYEVVVGRGRVFATRIANKRRKKKNLPPILVPFTITRDTDQQLMYKMAAENNQREDENVLQRAIEAKRLFKASGDMQYVARAYGVIVGTVSDWFKLLDGGKAVLDAVELGFTDPQKGITARQGIELAKIEIQAEREQLLADILAKKAAGEEVSTEAVRRAVRVARSDDAPAPAGGTEPEAPIDTTTWPAAPEAGKPAKASPTKAAAPVATATAALTNPLSKRTVIKVHSLVEKEEAEVTAEFMALSRALFVEEPHEGDEKLLGKATYASARALAGYFKPDRVAGLVDALRKAAAPPAKGKTTVHVVPENKRT